MNKKINGEKMADILQTIVDNKKKEVQAAKKKLPLSKIKKNLKKTDRNFFNALKGKNNIIAEIKYKSPSAGNMVKIRPLKEIVEAYDKYASAISVLTDKKFFAGKLKFIQEAKKYTKLPILRKDFIIDEYQVYESRHYGADAILLITSILSEKEIEKMLKIAGKYGMDCLVEIKTKEEIEKVLKTSAKIIGINNRNLSNFEINLKTTKNLKELIPKDKIIISESGIYTKKDILGLNTNAVLVGTSLIEAENITDKLSELHRTKVKICGITNQKDAEQAVIKGADLLGFNFYKKSPRYIKPTKARKIIQSLPNTVQSTGVFVNSSTKKVKKIEKQTGIDFIQIHGGETEEFCEKLGPNVIRVVRIENKMPLEKKILYARLYDTLDKEAYGGTGKEFDKTILANTPEKAIVAGGIKTENIKELFSTIHPYCIDVCSGVEKQPGQKDAEKIKDLIKAVRKNEN